MFTAEVFESTLARLLDHPVFKRLTFSPGGCWEWNGGKRHFGYGVIKIGGKLRPTHRAMYEAVKGPIPSGLFLDHLCRNPPCCNPDHLEPVTPRENVHRGLAGPRSACLRGHAYDAKNTRLNNHGAKTCRQCHRERMQRGRALNGV